MAKHPEIYLSALNLSPYIVEQSSTPRYYFLSLPLWVEREIFTLLTLEPNSHFYSDFYRFKILDGTYNYWKGRGVIEFKGFVSQEGVSVSMALGKEGRWWQGDKRGLIPYRFSKIDVPLWSFR